MIVTLKLLRRLVKTVWLKIPLMRRMLKIQNPSSSNKTENHHPFWKIKIILLPLHWNQIRIRQWNHQ